MKSIKLNKEQFLKWNMENQFFDEECIQDCMNLPKSIKIEMLKHAEDDLNKQGLLLADLIFNEYKYVEIFNNDCVYFCERK